MKVIVFILNLLLFGLNVGDVYASQTSLRDGDVVRISVYGNPDLSITTRITGGGKITFPLIGEVAIAQLSPRQAEEKIAKLLITKGYVKNPQVNLFIEKQHQAHSNMVTILGQIHKPGKYAIQDLESEGVESIIDLLAVAGGITPDASDYIVLIKTENGKKKKTRVDYLELMKNGDLSHNYKLDGNDIVLIPRMDVFYIYGQVQRPGQYRLERGMSVMQALSIAGSITARGTDRGIIVKRKDNNGKVQSIDVTLVDTLEANDVIYIKESIF